MIIHSHPTGNQNSRQAIMAFSEAGVLSSFCTALNISSHFLPGRVMPKAIRRELARRDFSNSVEDEKIVSVAPIREFTRLIAYKFGIDNLIQRETGWASIDAIYHSVDTAVAKKIKAEANKIRAVYAYEDGALESFKVAKQLGIARIYELPIGYWRTHSRLCKEEARLNPEWSHTWLASCDSEEKLNRKDAEIALASHIVVPSRFVVESLAEYPGELPVVSMIPYGCPNPISPDERRWYSGGTLRVLYVGGLSQRKGLSYLLDSVKPIHEKVELTIIGAGDGISLLSNRHRLLGSVPHSVVIEEMRCHDILVYPTFFEGYSLAVTEALSQGLPVITTPNSGAADCITEGKEGWIVPIRNSELISIRLKECIDSPGIVRKMGMAALKLAANNSWSKYRDALITQFTDW